MPDLWFLAFLKAGDVVVGDDVILPIHFMVAESPIRHHVADSLYRYAQAIGHSRFCCRLRWVRHVVLFFVPSVSCPALGLVLNNNNQPQRHANRLQPAGVYIQPRRTRNARGVFNKVETL